MRNEIELRSTQVGEIEADRRRSGRSMQLVFASLSLVTLALGVMINLFAVDAGLSREAVDVAAFGMLLAAVAHAGALWLWKE